MTEIKMAKKAAKDLGNHEASVYMALPSGRKYILCGTALAYEEDLAPVAEIAIHTLERIFHCRVADNTDAVAKMRDAILNAFVKATDAEAIVHGTDA